MVRLRWIGFHILVFCIFLGICSCDSSTTSKYKDGFTSFPSIVDSGSDLPGIHVQIVSLSGGTGPGGNFRPGDFITINFRVTDQNSNPLNMRNMDRAEVLVGGPSTNYQRVIPSNSSVDILFGLEKPSLTELKNDLQQSWVENSDGSYSYRISQAIPQTYGAPLQDTIKFTEGELTGQPLQDGTYTLALIIHKVYVVGKDKFRDTGTVVQDFLMGNATVLQPREVVRTENCNQCHHQLSHHNHAYREVKVCLLCHTGGSEDGGSTEQEVLQGNDPTKVTIHMGSIIHKIHNARFLPSVNGIATNPDGTRNYNATPTPFIVQQKEIFLSFSHEFKTAFPVMPNLIIPMPRDAGYSSLTAEQQKRDKIVRQGITNCDKCHGTTVDPDGAGPLLPVTPAQGSFAYTKPTRHMCGSCHDDINWNYPYTANGWTMPPQSDDNTCVNCHNDQGTIFSVKDAHLHPMENPNINPGLKVEITGLTGGSGLFNANFNNFLPGGQNNFVAGDKLAVTFTIKDNNNNNINPALLETIQVAISGPTTNMNFILHEEIPGSALPAAGPYTINLPRRVFHQPLGTSTGAPDTFPLPVGSPYWLVGANTAPTQILLVTGISGGSTTIKTAAKAGQNYIDVDDTTNFARGDYVVINNGGGGEEYLKIGWVDTAIKRIWFSSPHIIASNENIPREKPGLVNAHAIGITVQEVQVSVVPGTSYNVLTGTNQIGETTEFGPGKVLLTYSTDFTFPSIFPLAQNSSTDIDETWGKWEGKSIVNGSYEVGIWGVRRFDITPLYTSETNTYYNASSIDNITHFIVGTELYTINHNHPIPDPNACNGCHTNIQGHSGFVRGYNGCVLCHSAAGSEDRPVYVSGDPTLSTPGQTVEFRTMLHSIHMGKKKPDAENFSIIGHFNDKHNWKNTEFPAHLGKYLEVFATGTVNRFQDPNLGGQARHCEMCHGINSPTYEEPIFRAHPTEQSQYALSWKTTCTSCHADRDIELNGQVIKNHISFMSGGQTEACVGCHGPNQFRSVKSVHKVYGEHH